MSRCCRAVSDWHDFYTEEAYLGELAYFRTRNTQGLFALLLLLGASSSDSGLLALSLSLPLLALDPRLLLHRGLLLSLGLSLLPRSSESLLLLLALLLLEDVLPGVVDGAVLVRLVALALGEDAGGDEDADREALRPHTGLNDLLGCALVPAAGKGEGERVSELTTHASSLEEWHTERLTDSS